MIKSLLLAFVLFVIGFLMIVLGIRSILKKSPYHFFDDDEISNEMLSDVKKYNSSNAKMWCFSSIPFFILGILSIFFNEILISFISAGIAILDVVCLIIISHKISEKYFKSKWLWCFNFIKIQKCTEAMFY